MPFWLPHGTVLLQADRGRGAKAARRRAATPRSRRRRCSTSSSGTARATGTTTRRTCSSRPPSEREGKGEEREYALKPMNCPGACLVFASRRHSYRELPLRLAEFGLVSRYEREGVLHGLLRVRAFTQDDAHVFCTLDQVTDEVDSICTAHRRALRALRLRRRAGRALHAARRSRSAPTSSGSGPRRALREALERQGREYDVSPGEGTFYGPKIDFHITDALGRSWQCGTCQLDFQMPERFELTYIGADNAEHRPGDDPPRPARLDGALRRHPDRALRRPLPALAGARPGARAPGGRPAQRAGGRDRGASASPAACERVSTTAPSPSGEKIRDAELSKAPYMLVVGDKEIGVGDRSRCATTATATWARSALEELVERMREEAGE